MKSLFAYRLLQLIGHCLFTVLASARPCTLFYCVTVKQAFDNLGLLAGYGTKPIGAGLGRDIIPPFNHMLTMNHIIRNAILPFEYPRDFVFGYKNKQLREFPLLWCE